MDGPETKEKVVCGQYWLGIEELYLAFFFLEMTITIAKISMLKSAWKG